MSERICPDKNEFRSSLRFVSLFAAAHVVLVLLQSNFFPLTEGWNVVWLSLELLLCACALILTVSRYLYARKNKTPSLGAFEILFRKIRSPGLVILLLWTIWAYIACFLAIREDRTTFYNNVRYLFYQTTDMLVLFPLGLYYGRKGKMRFLSALYDVCLSLFSIQLLYCFVRFFQGSAKFIAFYGRQFDFTAMRSVFGTN